MEKPTVNKLSESDDKKKELKRKCKNFSIKEKLEIIDRLESEPLNNILKEINVNASTVRKWKKNRKELEDSLIEHIVQRKRRRQALNAEVDEALYIWLCESRRTGDFVTGTMLKQRALDLHEKMNCKTKFSASDGWLRNWKNRYNIKLQTTNKEKLLRDQEAAEEFITKFRNDVQSEGLSRKQVFNLVDTPLNYKSLPMMMFSREEESELSSLKTNVDRLTVTVCCNADGTFKLPLVIIGNTKNPKALDGIPKNHLPVYYRHQTKASMDTEIFEEWFKNEFVPKVTRYLTKENLPLRAVLLVNDCRAHLHLKVNSMETVIFPSNVMALIQPLGQGILEAVKRRYKYILTLALVSKKQDNVELPTLLTDVTIKEAIYWVNEAWEAVKQESIYKCWKKIWPVECKIENLPNSFEFVSSDTINSHDFIFSAEEDMIDEELTYGDVLRVLQKIDVYKNIRLQSVKDWIEQNDGEDFEKSLKDQGIINLSKNQSEEINENDKNLDSTNERAEFVKDNSVSGPEALNAIEKVIKFSNNFKLSLDTIVSLHKIKTEIMSLVVNSK
ncbi:jerky protein homolog-like isoform X1 [Microplitis demolitor]|uniref:jerky protein homolog-like isoform X1 n=1 Tax=Microplitis demolitor TaxID=69319 RepID=UPI00235B60F4|nr:jerky protein homolog-like isoform X1 [Microplitis demolitor]